MMRQSARLLLGIALFAACGSGGGSAAPPTTLTTRPTARSGPGLTVGPTVPPVTSAPLPGYASLVAVAVVPKISIYDRPAGSQVQTLDNPWSVDPHRPEARAQQVFLVETRRPDGWVRVLLPVRPNGSTGWLRATDVAIQEVTYAVKVELGARRITVLDRGAVVYRGPVAVGKPTTPTPTGRYYVRVLIKAPNPHTVYGPYAYGLSSHSDALSSFNGGDAEIGIHGNNDASVLGRAVTHGCIRIDNAEITTLAALLPLGTPVDVTL